MMTKKTQNEYILDLMNEINHQLETEKENLEERAAVIRREMVMLSREQEQVDMRLKALINVIGQREGEHECQNTNPR